MIEQTVLTLALIGIGLGGPYAVGRIILYLNFGPYDGDFGLAFVVGAVAIAIPIGISLVAWHIAGVLLGGGVQ